MLAFSGPVHAADLGIFENETEVGKLARAGSATFDKSSSAYLVSGGGENMWFTNDAFHFVWKRVSGDFGLSAAPEFIGSGGNAHRKACLIVRQSLEPDSAYVDLALHGDGLTSFQFRESAGGMTDEIQTIQKMPQYVGIQRQGNVFFALLPAAD